jgi:hypothetical protein
MPDTAIQEEEGGGGMYCRRVLGQYLDTLYMTNSEPAYESLPITKQQLDRGATHSHTVAAYSFIS